MHIPKWLIATAVLLFIALIASVAFFIGREPSHPAEPPSAAMEIPQEPVAVREPAPEEPKRPLAAAVSETKPTEAIPSSASVFPPSATGATSPPADTSPAAAETRARVAAYFQQMDALQSGGSGDQEAFANTLMQAALSGDFSGIDDLVRA